MGALDLMFQNGMKSTGSYALGQQLANDQQMNAAKLQEQQLANENAAVMNPLNQQFKQGQINEQQAQLPGLVGQSQTLASQGQVEAATTPYKIAQRISSLSNQIGVDKMQQMGREGQIASQAAEITKNYPPALHKEVYEKVYTQLGGDPNSPVLQGILKADDGNVVNIASTLGQGMALASHDYQQKLALQKDDNASKERIEDERAAAQIYTAKIAAESRKAAADARAKAMAKIPKTEDKIAILEEAEANGTATPEESDLLRRLKTHVYNEKTLAAPAVAPTVLNQETPTDRAKRLANGGSGQPATKPPTPTPGKTVVQTGTAPNGRKVFKYSDGSIDYGN